MPRTIDLGDFPYDSFLAAKKDNFAKLGGQDEAFVMLVKAWKQAAWHKTAQVKQQGKRDREKAITVAVEQRAARAGLTVDDYLKKLEAQASA